MREGDQSALPSMSTGPRAESATSHPMLRAQGKTRAARRATLFASAQSGS